MLYRLARWCHMHRLRVASEVLLRVSQRCSPWGIAYKTGIGPGLVLRHPMCVVIGRRCRVGRDVTIFHGVTLGNRLSGGPSRPEGSPVVEDGLLVGAGAKIVGSVTGGAGSTLDANSAVTASVPPGSVVVGMPARPMKTAANGSVTRDTCPQAPAGDPPGIVRGRRSR